MEEWEEIKPWEEAPVATGPTKSSYSPGEEQAQRMEGHLGPELNRRLEIMAAQMWVIDRMKAKLKGHLGFFRLARLMDELVQEIKAELK